MKSPFQVTILGSSSALPTAHRLPTSQFLQINNQYFLIDCGEGTQVQLRKTKVPHSKINHIFISHLHGDHIFGLPGLLSTYSLLGRKVPLHIYAHSELQKYIALQTELLGDELNYDLVFHPLNFKRPMAILETKEITVHSIPLNHKTPCCGFVFREKQKQRNLKKDMVEYYQVPVREMQNIKNGNDFTTAEGKVIRNERLTTSPPASRSYAFCTDTRPINFSECEEMQNLDLLYHEATFMDKEKGLAIATGHSTAKQAAEVAKKINAKQLILGHFSSRYKTVRPLEEEAKIIFKNTKAVNDRDRYGIQ